MTEQEWKIFERHCHRWLVLNDPDYRRAWLASCLIKHKAKRLIQECLKPSTPSIPKTTTTPS